LNNPFCPAAAGHPTGGFFVAREVSSKSRARRKRLAIRQSQHVQKAAKSKAFMAFLEDCFDAA
jgi:hypothetical protein